MTRSWIVVGLLALLLVGTGGIAVAKGPVGATIAGPGLSAPIIVGGEGEPAGSGGGLGELADATGLFAAIFGRQPSPLTAAAPAGRLGPRYAVTYEFHSDNGVDGVVQDVYPYAEGGPVTYTRAGQPFFGVETRPGGWFRAPARLTTILVGLGVPAQQVGEAQSVQRSAAPAALPAQGRIGDPPAPAVAAAAAALLLLAVACSVWLDNGPRGE